MFLRALAAAAVVAAALATAADARVPSDPLVASWTYGAVNLPAAWDVTTGSERVTIAVVDSGVDPAHPDLLGAVDAGYDFVDEDTDARDANGHGTAVAGIAAGRADNALGGAGVCWACRIMPLRVIGPGGFARLGAVARAIDYAVAHGAAVVNASLYGETLDFELRDAIRRARASGVVVVAAAGNEGDTRLEYPAGFPETVSVGATTEQNELATYSSRGAWVKLGAPACMPTAQLGGGFGPGCGTSGAAPVVAGVLGLLRSRAPFATASELEGALQRTARPLAGVRFGLVDAQAALLALGQPAPRLEPTIDGVADVGRTLRGYSGVWTGAGLEIAYRWERCRNGRCEPVATGRAFTVRRQDRGYRLRLVLAAPGIEPASAMTAVVAEAPRNTLLPRISGTPAVGSRLVGHPGSWTGTGVRFAYAWIRCELAGCARGSIAFRGRVYRAGERDRGRRLRLVVTARNAVGQAAASSAPTGTVT